MGQPPFKGVYQKLGTHEGGLHQVLVSLEQVCVTTDAWKPEGQVDISL